jgi:hypothetical protein
MYIRGRLAKLYGGLDANWAEKPRADFSTAVLTPESTSTPHVVVNDDDEDWDPDLPAWASLAVANATADRRNATSQRSATAGQPSLRSVPGDVMEATPPPDRNVLDRRRADRGPPSGMPDRRQARSFGRRPTH